MGRPRAFDKTQVLDKAVQVFWAQGYEAASLAELTRAMGISRSSFYATFGTKRDLFLAALRRYGETTQDWRVDLLEGDTPGAAAIRTVIEAAVAAALADGRARGCLLGNAAAEVSAGDPLIGKRIRAALARMARAYHAAVVRGQAAGDISRRHDPRALARFLLSSVTGLGIVGKANPDRAVLEDIARVTLAALDDGLAEA